jgi:hypothetical protein
LVVALASRDALRARGWPEPILCDSGNGYHLIYAVDLPNDAEIRGLIKAFLVALAGMFDTPARRSTRRSSTPPGS